MKKDIKYPDNIIMEVIPPSSHLREFRDAFYKKLNNKERDVIQRIYDNGESASSIAKEYGVCATRIYQIKEKAIKKIRIYIGRKHNPQAPPDESKTMLDIAREEATKMIVNEMLKMSSEPIDMLNPSVRTRSTIKRHTDIKILASLYTMELGDLLSITHMGRKSSNEIIQKLILSAIQRISKNTGENENG